MLLEGKEFAECRYVGFRASDGFSTTRIATVMLESNT